MALPAESEANILLGEAKDTTTTNFGACQYSKKKFEPWIMV